MIQDIAPFHFSNMFRAVKPKSSDYFFCINNHTVLLLLTDMPTPTIPRFKDMEKWEAVILDNFDYLFTVNECACFLVRGFFETKDLKYYDTKILLGLQPNWIAFAGTVACQLQEWYSSHKFCGRCGSTMSKSREERALECKSCNTVEYPNISPVIIVGIIDNEKLLLTKYANRDYQNYALIAGFVEIGETLEEAVKREVKEEVGLNISHLQYYKSQPWPFSKAIMIGYFAKLEGDNSIHMDKKELSEVHWFLRNELPHGLSSISLTYDMIEAFRNGVVF